MSADPLIVGAYRTLLLLYPREFREAYSADMVQLLRDQCNDEPQWRVGGRAALDLAITIPTQHLEAHMNRNAHLVPMLYSALAGGGLLFAILGGSNTTIVVIGMCITVVAGSIAAVTWRRSGPIGSKTSTDGWWKLVLAGPCIIVAVIVAASLGVEAWELGVLAVSVAFVITGVGALLGIARLARRHPRSVPT